MLPAQDQCSLLTIQRLSSRKMTGCNNRELLIHLNKMLAPNYIRQPNTQLQSSCCSPQPSPESSPLGYLGGPTDVFFLMVAVAGHASVSQTTLTMSTNYVMYLSHACVKSNDWSFKCCIEDDRKCKKTRSNDQRSSGQARDGLSSHLA